jgi:hypothetical protein
VPIVRRKAPRKDRTIRFVHKWNRFPISVSAPHPQLPGMVRRSLLLRPVVSFAGGNKGQARSSELDWAAVAPNHHQHQHRYGMPSGASTTGPENGPTESLLIAKAMPRRFPRTLTTLRDIFTPRN